MAQNLGRLDEQLKRLALPNAREVEILAAAERAEMIADAVFRIVAFLGRFAKALTRALRSRAASGGTSKHVPLRGA